MKEDVVCGMKVKEDTPYKSEFQGKTFYFCNAVCKTSFDANPGKYTRSQEAHHNLEHNCC